MGLVDGPERAVCDYMRPGSGLLKTMYRLINVIGGLKNAKEDLAKAVGDK